MHNNIASGNGRLEPYSPMESSSLNWASYGAIMDTSLAIRRTTTPLQGDSLAHGFAARKRSVIGALALLTDSLPPPGKPGKSSERSLKLSASMQIFTGSHICARRISTQWINLNGPSSAQATLSFCSTCALHYYTLLQLLQTHTYLIRCRRHRPVPSLASEQHHGGTLWQ